MKLSDALRGAADRAPVDDASVAVDMVTGRVRRQRALRAGSTGVLGAGACALVLAAALGPVASSMSTEYSVAPEMDAAESLEDGASDAFSGGAADSALARAELWACGTTFSADDGAWTWGDTSGVTYTVGEPETGDGEVLLPATLTAHRAVDLISGSDYVITWDGIVVGRMVNPDPVMYGPADEPMLPEDVYERLDPATDFSELETANVLQPVNCWDGEPLPAATYEVHQAWTLAYADAAADAQMSPEDGAAPDESPAAESDTEPAAPSATAEGAGTTGSAAPLESPMPEVFRVAAPAVMYEVDGERADEPFAKYLSGEPGEPVTPIDPVEPVEGALTTAIARELYDATRVTGGWDMAPGSQRWVRTYDSATAASQEPVWFGCSWGQPDGRDFPNESAEMALLDVDVDAPASISVSYGFVVDGNPLMTAQVTNVSEYAIPGWWAEVNPTLHLVRDGRVVAEGYPTPVNRAGGMVEPAIADDVASNMLVMPESGHLAPGATVAAEVLWRDVSACGEAAPSGVASGTYTLLAQTSVSVSDQSSGYGVSDSAVDGAGEVRPYTEETLEPLVLDEPAIAPSPGGEPDWIDFQVWTSLGSVTVR